MTGSHGTSQQPTVDEATRFAFDDRGPGSEVGRKIGRYVVLDEVGAGGMGRVYRAYDPKLRREVALKRLRMASGFGTEARGRMLREAQAMAQLSDPHVVPVYDVDVDQGGLYIAMEYVEGQTLGGWLAEAERSWSEVLDVFIEAGKGLAAAHRQGIVHRDFKPANVIVGADGRTRVMDFGVARSLDGSPSSAGVDEETKARAEASTSGWLETDSEALTEHGAVLGTPAYMAPEQHAGSETDSRTDQYAFCIALWEALYGERPFTGKDLKELAHSKYSTPSRPKSSSVPSSVHAIVVRGLSVRPSARWADMPAILDALDRTRARRWPRPVAVVGAVAVVGIGVAVTAGEESPCEQGAERIAPVWSPSVAERVAEGLTGSGVGFAESTVERVRAALDSYAGDWVAMHQDACEATHVRHEQSDEALDLRMACLAARRQSLETTVEVLASADDSVAEKAVEVVTSLPPISDCADVARLRQRLPPPEDPKTAVAVDEAREQLERATVLLRASKITDARTVAESTLATARELDYLPLLAEAELMHAQVLWAAGEEDAARPEAEHAFKAALQLSMSHLAANATLVILDITEAHDGRYSGTPWLPHVALALAEGDGTDPPLTAEAMLLVGALYVEQERLRDAEPYFRGAVEHVEQNLGPEHPSLVSLLISWSNLIEVQGRRDEARQTLERARTLAEKAFGPDHPATANAIKAQAWQFMGNGEFARAEEAFNEVRRIYEAALGPEHPTTIALLATMAGSLAEQGRFDEAIANLEEAERRFDSITAEDHPTRASIAHNMATVRWMQGDYARAVEGYRKAIAIRRRLGMKNDLAAALIQLGKSLIELERYDEAEEALKEADAIDEELFADRGVRSGGPLLWLAKIARVRGDLEGAREYLERARSFDDDDFAPRRVEVAWLLGSTLWELGVDKPRAHALVEEAQRLVQESPRGSLDEIGEHIDAWLSEHSTPR